MASTHLTIHQTADAPILENSSLGFADSSLAVSAPPVTSSLTPAPISTDAFMSASTLSSTTANSTASSSSTPPVDTSALRRIRPGTKAVDMAEGPPVVDISEIESAFQLTEYLKALYYSLTHPEDCQHIIPLNHSMALRIATPPPGVEKNLWLYELCLFLCQKINALVVALFTDDPPCSSNSCPSMRAADLQYICAVHNSQEPCCAIDYCCHTLDWASNILTSPRNFPSRLALGTEPGTITRQVRQLTNVFRRVYRIFAHAWFQHPESFWKVENKTGLYVLFMTVCNLYDLIPDKYRVIPKEALDNCLMDESDSNSWDRSLIPCVPETLHSSLDGTGGSSTEPLNDVSISSPSIGSTKRVKRFKTVKSRILSEIFQENDLVDSPTSNKTLVNKISILSHRDPVSCPESGESQRPNVDNSVEVDSVDSNDTHSSCLSDDTTIPSNFPDSITLSSAGQDQQLFEQFRALITPSSLESSASPASSVSDDAQSTTAATFDQLKLPPVASLNPDDVMDSSFTHIPHFLPDFIPSTTSTTTTASSTSSQASFT